jgi:hypothetical protein
VFFHGIFPIPTDVEYTSLIVELELMQKVIDEIKSTFNLTEESLLYTVTPSVLPKEKSASNDAIR